MNVPCTDHDNCPLNITLLRAAIKKLEAGHRETARAFKDAERSVHAPTHDWREHDALRNRHKSEAVELHLLYQTRAHHRGKLHAHKYRAADRGDVTVTIERQAIEVAETWKRFKRVPKTDAAA